MQVIRTIKIEIKERRCEYGLCEEMARQESVKAQTPQDAQKDTLAATEIAHKQWLVDILSDRGCRMEVSPRGLKRAPPGIPSQQS
jgi:hypothetical protein